jgi:hypothetical protein
MSSPTESRGCRNAIRDLLALDVDVSSLPLTAAIWAATSPALPPASPLLPDGFITAARRVARWLWAIRTRRLAPSSAINRDFSQNAYIEDAAGTRGAAWWARVSC